VFDISDEHRTSADIFSIRELIVEDIEGAQRCVLLKSAQQAIYTGGDWLNSWDM
jgi:hypothetical protein